MSFAPDAHQVTTTDGITISGLDFAGFHHATISGRVLTTSGGPMSGVTVTATAAGGTTAADDDVTDVRGVYSLSVPFGRYTVAASRAGYSYADVENVNVGPGEAKSLDDFEATGTIQAVGVMAKRTVVDRCLQRRCYRHVDGWRRWFNRCYLHGPVVYPGCS